MAWMGNYIPHKTMDVITYPCLNTLRPRQNGRLFADDTFKRIFLNENDRIPIEISLKFVPKGLINNIPALVLIMAWRRPGDKPLSEPMTISLLTHICVTRSQWVNLSSSMLVKRAPECEVLCRWLGSKLAYITQCITIGFGLVLYQSINVISIQIIDSSCMSRRDNTARYHMQQIYRQLLQNTVSLVESAQPFKSITYQEINAKLNYYIWRLNKEENGQYTNKS